MKLLKTVVGIAALATMPVRQIVGKVNRPLLRMCTARTLKFTPIAHAQQTRFMHATASLERKRKSKKHKEVKMTRHHGKHHCNKGKDKRLPACERDRCICLPGTFRKGKEMPEHCKPKTCQVDDNAHRQDPYRKQ